MRLTATECLVGATLAAVALPALPSKAQSPPASPPDSASIWSIQGENASLTTSALPDRDYTNGIRLGWTSAEGGAPEPLERLGQRLWGDGRQRIAVDATQQIYTPTDSNSVSPKLNDRPYAAVLLGTVSLIQDGADTRSVLALGLGVVGPSALGDQVQNGFHDLIDQNPKRGWNTQLHDEPLIEITSARSWRLPTGAVGAVATDAVPEITAAVGNLRIYAQTGVIFRLGQGLDSDYGAPRLLPGQTGTDVFRPTRPFGWYVFAGADAQAVGYDITLNGNTWQDSRSVKLVPAVAELEGGFAVMTAGLRLTYTHVMQTLEYAHQRGGLHQFGSLALSLRF